MSQFLGVVAGICACIFSYGFLLVSRETTKTTGVEMALLAITISIFLLGAIIAFK